MTLVIEYESEGFPARAPISNGSKSLTSSWDDLLWSALILPDGAADAMALWVMFTHTFDAAQVSPRMGLLSPLPECGKTSALSLLGRLVPRPVLASNVSPAVVYRFIESCQPTLLMDEADLPPEAKLPQSLCP